MSTQTPAIATSFLIQSPSNNVVNFASSHAKGLGIVQITLGILSIIFHIPTIVYHFGTFMIGHGIWCGIFYIIAGGLTLGAVKNKNKCMIVASLTLSIIASVAASVQVSLGIVGGILSDDYWYYDHKMNFAGQVAINSLIALFGLIAFVICIITSALGCKALCCSGSTQTGVPVQVITLQDGRVVNAIVLPTHNLDSTFPNESMLLPSYDPITTNEKKLLI
ncbi:hypothetical protein CAPTEDRAFT_223887 [Capitella teleta]|uniref:Uncharacterized protein n=1 Tax=Capitella teleta TaxID=283909 RepID=R7TPZ4_CAPTE|nr:hypothetical protein CAPTEDRAFT_223887 [Capitella teleta]|eukprot:ELT93110.1 hypothetical protein CAPTEDRAFT_223887 [Capitella teleta]